MTIEDKGLPFHKNSYKFGNLFVLFKVKFPDTLGANPYPSKLNILSNEKEEG